MTSVKPSSLAIWTAHRDAVGLLEMLRVLIAQRVSRALAISASPPRFSVGETENT